MSRTTKRFLSILLAAAMILSLGITGWAIDDEIEIIEPETPASEKDPHVTDGFDGGTDLELKEIDPSTLNVPRLGEIEEEDDILISEDLPFGLNDIVRVSIVLFDPSTMSAGYATQGIAYNPSAMAYRASLRQQQANVEAAIASAGVSMNVKWNLTLAVNIISAEVRYGDIETIEQVPGVKAVWLETRYEPQVDEINTAVTTEHMVGAAALWAEGYTGAGSRIAIIDTGTDQDHISFDAEALEYALAEDGGDYDLLTWDEISAVKAELNANTHKNSSGLTSSVYKNTKIPFAYNYVDGGYITDHMSDTQGEHGSHVSGIAAANRYLKVNGEFVSAVQTVGAVGVAPDAQILTMKVFGSGGGAYDSDYMSAIEDAIVLGADSVNLSLGSGSPGFSFSNGYQDVMNGLVGSGTVVTISSGNSGAWYDTPLNENMYPYLYMEDVGYHTGGSPGSFTNSFTIASADNIGAFLTPLFFNGDEDTPISYSETSGYGNNPIATIPGNYEYVLVNGPGVDDNDHVGAEGDAFMALGEEVVKGKVAICYRGTSSFFAKANAAAAQGAVAVIIINNQAGVINMNLSGYLYNAPAVSVLKAVGDELLANSTEVTDANGNVYYTGTVTVASEMQSVLTADRSGANMSSFSSWGVPGSLTLKPEMTTPGGSIFSVWGANKGSSSPTDSHEDYENMSGTSMAAPHAAGMAALVAQFIRENDLLSKTNLDQRALINSLLMSTATPMFDTYGEFVPVMQQGAGLGDAHAATQAKSYITMNADATASYADGKVKVELGQDAAREGVYNFSFNVNNFSDVDMSYALETYIFTQAMAGSAGYGVLQDPGTAELNGYFGAGAYDVSYGYPTSIPNLHDVDMDGDTDTDDAQAILDYITGAFDTGIGYEYGIDDAAGEMDGVEGLSSYDAQLLLEWLEEVEPGLIVPAGESVTVYVTITLSDDAKEIFDYYYSKGAYIEGFTYVIPTTETDDGEILGVEHSIPILGFYGSWTDPSMFDAVSPIDAAYGSTKLNYIATSDTNFLTINTGKGNTTYMGNPYAVEDEFPVDRLAISPNTKLVNFRYNMIRNAATTGWIALDENCQVIKNGPMSGAAYGAWYYVNGATWQDITTRMSALNTTVSSLGVAENDVFTLGFFAIPEYYGMLLHPGEDTNTVSPAEIGDLLASGELGEGAYIGYTFTVDAKAPTAEAKLSDDGTKITVTAQDDKYIAFIGIMDVSGNTLFAGEVPEQSEPGEEVEITFDVSDLELPNGVAIFVGDYAANETAYLIVFDPDQPVVSTKTVWLLTDKLEAGKEYIITSSKDAGTTNALLDQGEMTYTGAAQLPIVSDSNGIYIESADASDAVIWTTLESGSDTAGYVFQSNSSGCYLGYASSGSPFASWSQEGYADLFVYSNNCLVFQSNARRGMTFSGSAFTYTTSAPTPVYLFTPATIEVEMDPSQASAVTVAPDKATLIIGVNESIELVATVEPIVVADRTVTWTSSDETVATVSTDGLVTAVAPGAVTITATSNQTPEVFGTAAINVVESQPMDAVVYGQVAFGDDDIEYGIIDLNDMSVTDISNNAMFSAFYGGGRSGDFIYGNDIDNDFHRYNAEDNFAYDDDYHFAINATWGLIDIACFPSFSIVDAGTTYDYNYILTGFNATDKLCYFDEEGSLTYFDLADLGSFVAVTFAGINYDPDEETFQYYYLLLAEDGTLYLWAVYPNTSSGSARMSAEYQELAYINMLTFGEDKTAYSMSYYETDEEWGVFISDNSCGGIYYVDLNKLDAESNVDATFIGRISGATNLGSLSDFNYDTQGPVGTIDFSAASIGLPMANAALRNVIFTGETLFSMTDRYAEPEGIDYEIVSIEGDEPEDDTVYVDIIGGLDAATNRAPRRDVELESAELLNPDTYSEDGYVEIGVFTPNFDPDATPEEPALFYNGFATVEYDPDVLTFDGYEVHPLLQLTSVNVDEDNGIINIAYASLEPIEEGLYAVVSFTAPTKATEVTVTTIEGNDDLDIGEVTVIELGAEGFTITVEDHTNGGATTSIEADALYSGEVTFTVAADQAVAVILKEKMVPNAIDYDDEGFLYETIECVTEGETHSFTIMVEKDTTICLVYKGDVNINGAVETKDGTMIKRYAVGSYDLTDPLERLVADVDGSGEVEAKDGTMIARAVVGSFEIPW